MSRDVRVLYMAFLTGVKVNISFYMNASSYYYCDITYRSKADTEQMHLAYFDSVQWSRFIYVNTNL
jgi:hypothetical protein